jgi:hypothetical protein
MKMWTDKGTFGAGELSPGMARRSDTQQHADGARRMRNVRLLNAGGFARRPGSLHLTTLAEGARLVEFTFNIDQQYLLAFSAGRMDACFPDGVAAGTLTGCPWTADDVPVMTWSQSGDTVILACRSFPPQVVKRVDSASWSREDWVADEGPGGASLQPYYKFAAPDSTIQPSAVVGSIEIVASESVFVSTHVGARIRYAGGEITVTGVADGMHATGSVVDGLSPTQRLTVDDSGGFVVGHLVEGRNTAAKGEVVAVGSGHIDVVISDRSAIRFSSTEKVTGPLVERTISAVEDVAPAAYRDWDEQYLSPTYGYPAAVGLHRQRLWFGGHTRLPASVLASRIGAFYNFDLGTAEDAEALFEDLGDGAVAAIKHFVSAENLIIVTDQGAYYVPETASNPIRPSSIQFHRVGADGGSDVRPVSFDEGLLYRHVSGSGVMDVRPTGDVTKSWSAVDLALLADHLLRAPTDMAATHGADGAPERYAFAVNSDGTMAVLHAIQSQKVLGWTLWETDGAYRSVAVLGGKIFAVVERDFAGVTRWCLERFDQELTTDGAVILPTGGGSAPLFAGMTVHARSGTSYLGPVEIPAGGVVPDLDAGGAAVELGRLFTPLVETLPPEPKFPSGSVAARVKRISGIRVYALGASRLRVGDRIMSAHDIGEDVTAAPRARSGWIEARLLGRSREPTVTITQDEPLPMTVLGISMEVIV